MKVKKEKSKLCEFWWVDIREQKFYLRIYGKSVLQIENLLNKYRESDTENYLVKGWMDFLRNKGVRFTEEDLSVDFRFRF